VNDELLRQLEAFAPYAALLVIGGNLYLVHRDRTNLDELTKAIVDLAGKSRDDARALLRAADKIRKDAAKSHRQLLALVQTIVGKALDE
jgi:hypothetical protein